MKWKGPEIDDDVLFAVCEKVVNGRSAAQVSRELLEQRKVEISREQVYTLLRRGIKREFLRLCAPLEHSIARELSEKYRVEFRVVNVRGQTTVERVAAAGADLALELIHKVKHKKSTVHLGLAAGDSLRLLARDLGKLMRAEPKLPNLVLHALSSGISSDDPTAAPVAFFSFFHDVTVDMRFVGLFAPAVVLWDEYENMKAMPGISGAFEQKDNIDIVIVSMASAKDRHGRYNTLMRRKKRATNVLKKAGWVGDLHWRPFSKKGPINKNTGVRSITLFELEELAEWASRPDKHIVLVASLCGRCGRSKSDALRPLLETPELRVFNHVVTDVETARSLL